MVVGTNGELSLGGEEGNDAGGRDEDLCVGTTDYGCDEFKPAGPGGYPDRSTGTPSLDSMFVAASDKQGDVTAEYGPFNNTTRSGHGSISWSGRRPKTFSACLRGESMPRKNKAALCFEDQIGGLKSRRARH